MFMGSAIKCSKGYTIKASGVPVKKRGLFDKIFYRQILSYSGRDADGSTVQTHVENDMRYCEGECIRNTHTGNAGASFCNTCDYLKAIVIDGSLKKPGLFDRTIPVEWDPID